MRCAIRLSSTPATSARAFTTWSRDTPTAQFAGDQLEEGEPLVLGQRRDPAREPRIARLLVERRQRQQALAHPVIERGLIVAGPLRQQQGQRLGEVADVRIGFLDQPLGQPRALDRETAHKACRHGLARLAAGKEIDHPGRARPLRRVRLRRREGLDQRRLLGADRRRRLEPPVEIGERFHAATGAGSSSSPP